MDEDRKVFQQLYMGEWIEPSDEFKEAYRANWRYFALSKRDEDLKPGDHRPAWHEHKRMLRHLQWQCNREVFIEARTAALEDFEKGRQAWE